MKALIAPMFCCALLAVPTAEAQQTPTPNPSTVIPEKIEPLPLPSSPRAGAPTAEPSRTTENMGLPDACRRAAALSGYVDMPMDGGLPQPMQDSASRLSETQRALMQAMIRMHAAMMQGMAAKDADVAWVCAMIPHHQGAIDMARAGLAGSDNAESRRMAEETIRMQQAEIAKLTRWAEAHAERESRNESGQPQRP